MDNLLVSTLACSTISYVFSYGGFHALPIIEAFEQEVCLTSSIMAQHVMSSIEHGFDKQSGQDYNAHR